MPILARQYSSLYVVEPHLYSRLVSSVIPVHSLTIVHDVSAGYVSVVKLSCSSSPECPVEVVHDEDEEVLATTLDDNTSISIEDGDTTYVSVNTGTGMGVIGEEVIDIDGDNNAATTVSCSEVDELLLNVSVEGDD